MLFYSEAGILDIINEFKVLPACKEHQCNQIEFLLISILCFVYRISSKICQSSKISQFEIAGYFTEPRSRRSNVRITYFFPFVVAF